MRFLTGSLPLKTIVLDSICWEDQTCLLRFGRDDCPAELKASLQSHGLISPPLVFERHGGEFGIVCGFARLRVSKKSGCRNALVRVAPLNTPVSSLLLAAIEDNYYGRGFNPIEIAMAIEKCTSCLTDSEILSTVFPALRLAPSVSLLQRYRTYRRLPLTVQKYLASGQLPEGLAGDLADFAPEEQEILSHCIVHLRLTFSMAREMLRQVNEIHRRDSIAIALLLNECGYPLASPSDAGQQNSPRSAFLACIRKRRYPNLARLEETRKRHVAALHLPPNMVLRFPKNFEGDEFCLEAKLRSAGELEAAAQALIRLVAERSEDLKAIFNPCWKD